MTRKLPRSFFWIDQEVLRRGLWIKLSPSARMAYVAIAATCDREGLSIWSRNKLMELAGITDPEAWQTHLSELSTYTLIEVHTDHIPAAIKLLPIEVGSKPEGKIVGSGPRTATLGMGSPIVIHTHTSIQFGGEKAEHVEPRNPE